MITATKRARERVRVARWMATVTKRARAMAARGMMATTRVKGNKKGNGDGNNKGNGTNNDNMGNYYGKESDGHSTAVTTGTA
jgi:hypothetical protein